MHKLLVMAVSQILIFNDLYHFEEYWSRVLQYISQNKFAKCFPYDQTEDHSDEGLFSFHHIKDILSA